MPLVLLLLLWSTQPCGPLQLYLRFIWNTAKCPLIWMKACLERVLQIVASAHGGQIPALDNFLLDARTPLITALSTPQTSIEMVRALLQVRINDNLCQCNRSIRTDKVPREEATQAFPVLMDSRLPWWWLLHATSGRPLESWPVSPFTNLFPLLASSLPFSSSSTSPPTPSANSSEYVPLSSMMTSFVSCTNQHYSSQGQPRTRRIHWQEGPHWSTRSAWRDPTWWWPSYNMGLRSTESHPFNHGELPFTMDCCTMLKMLTSTSRLSEHFKLGGLTSMPWMPMANQPRIMLVILASLLIRYRTLPILLSCRLHPSFLFILSLFFPLRSLVFRFLDFRWTLFLFLLLSFPCFNIACR